METGINGRLKRAGNGKTLADRHDVTGFSKGLRWTLRGNKPVPVFAVAVPFQSTVELPFRRGVPL